MVFCLFAAFYHIIYLIVNKDFLENFIIYDNINLFTIFIIRLGNWILIFSNFIPITLIVTLELVKYLQGIVI